jgi:hypothetical protein
VHVRDDHELRESIRFVSVVMHKLPKFKACAMCDCMAECECMGETE